MSGPSPKKSHPDRSASVKPFGGPLSNEAEEDERAEERIAAPLDESTPAFRNPLAEREGEQEEYEAGAEPDAGAPEQPQG